MDGVVIASTLRSGVGRVPNVITSGCIEASKGHTYSAVGFRSGFNWFVILDEMDQYVINYTSKSICNIRKLHM